MKFIIKNQDNSSIDYEFDSKEGAVWFLKHILKMKLVTTTRSGTLQAFRFRRNGVTRKPVFVGNICEV